MKPRARIYTAVARTVYSIFFLVTSLYCMFAYLPFTYMHVLKAALLPTLVAFARFHPLLYWIVLALMIPAVEFKRDRWHQAFWIVHILAGILLAVRPVLVNLDNTTASLWWALGSLAPSLYLTFLTWRTSYPAIRWGAGVPADERRVFHAAWLSGLTAAILYAGVAILRKQPGEWGAAEAWFGFCASLLIHTLVFVLFFVTLNLLTVISTWFPSPPRAQFILMHLLGAGLLFTVIRVLVFSALSFSGALANIYGLALSLTVTGFLAGFCASLAAAASFDTSNSEVSSGLSLSLWWMRPPEAHRGRFRTLVTIALTGAIAIAATLQASAMDWNYLIQKLTALVAWVAIFRLFFVAVHPKNTGPVEAGRLLVCAFLILPAYRSFEAARTVLWKQTGSKQTSAQFLEKWAGYDISFQLLNEAITPVAGDPGFYRYLVRNTNLPRSTYVAPVPVDLVESLEPTAGKKPNIFLIVVDSLRRDYLSPYNPQVDFTPEIGRFAQESVVMQNAFTRYGATGLSEPSIWVGGMLLHKQYVTPFAPMNALQKLLEAEKYRAYISRDEILTTVVHPWPRLIEMDEGRQNMDYDLCSSLDELENKIASDPGGAPLFAYNQPQNIHISVINRQGAKPISNENYGRFYAPYASRLRRMDACFGRFIDSLKQRGLYDSSIVILTADHGDSLGENGRWGHAYTIYPEVVRIPLLIHLPAALRENHYFNEKDLAFSTDITPSLYYLTGHKPTNHSELLGRPLFTDQSSEAAAWRRESYLLASSYAAVYGILSGDGKQLTVADAVNYKDYFLDLSSSSPSADAVSTSTKTWLEGLIRTKVIAIDTFYGFTPLK
jgi:hypothetical protein